MELDRLALPTLPRPAHMPPPPCRRERCDAPTHDGLGHCFTYGLRHLPWLDLRADLADSPYASDAGLDDASPLARAVDLTALLFTPRSLPLMLAVLATAPLRDAISICPRPGNGPGNRPGPPRDTPGTGPGNGVLACPAFRLQTSRKARGVAERHLALRKLHARSLTGLTTVRQSLTLRCAASSLPEGASQPVRRRRSTSSSQSHFVAASLRRQLTRFCPGGTDRRGDCVARGSRNPGGEKATTATTNRTAHDDERTHGWQLQRERHG